jgi:excisionase family DNA binding protein
MSTDTTKKRRKIERPRTPGAPYTIDQAAAELNIAPRTVRKRIAEQRLRSYRDGRKVLIAERELVEYRRGLEQQAQPTATGTAMERIKRIEAGMKGKGA